MLLQENEFPGWLPPVSPSLREAQFPPASPVGSPRSAFGGDTGPFQTATSVLGLRARVWRLYVESLLSIDL